MPNYSKSSRDKLAIAHIDLQRIFEVVIMYYDNTIVYTFRGDELQNRLFDEGKSKLKYPKSKHNHYPAMAVDSAPYINGKVSDDMNQCYFYSGYVLGVAEMLYKYKVISHKLIGGSDWDDDKDVNDQKFRDLWHFQLINIEGK